MHAVWGSVYAQRLRRCRSNQRCAAPRRCSHGHGGSAIGGYKLRMRSALRAEFERAVGEMIASRITQFRGPGSDLRPDSAARAYSRSSGLFCDTRSSMLYFWYDLTDVVL